MKMTLIALSMTPLLALGTWGAAAAEAFDAAKRKAILEEALIVVQPLPDKMPGSEQDTAARVTLGEKLYFDPILSENKSQSCNTCHLVDEGRAGVDHERTSPGAFKERGDRNTPTSLNAGFHFAQFWDGRSPDLKDQAKGPVLNPVEMAMPDETVVLKRLKADAVYPQMFAKAFSGSSDPITYDNMAEAIAAFERTLITRDRLDDFLKGDLDALTDGELQGLRTFLDMGCTACHNGPVIGAGSFQKSGLINPYEFAKDLGRFTVTENDDDKHKFKVPSLRNVALTFPYFHDGKVDKLSDVVKRMGYMQLGMEFTSEQIDPLVAYLNTLSGKGRRAGAEPPKN